MQTGQAAGVAAALSARMKRVPRQVDIDVLQHTLREQDAHIILPGENISSPEHAVA